MCGITGFFSNTFSEEQLLAMTKKLQHRGPDAEGYYYNREAGIGLGHRRLSILDLSVAANNPFWSKDGRYVMVYNGEVYNFREVAEKYNIIPTTSSDTEIIVEAFAKKGIDCLQDFNGMFAMAIWDSRDKKLYLIRDRAGIKPLYYYHKDNQLAFASELKAIMTLPVDKQIDSSSISNFLYLGYIPGSNSIYEHTKKLLPGHYAVWDGIELTMSSYWELEDHLLPETMSDEVQAKKTLKSLVESSVSYCMISDVPVGIFLSGGVDSSLVAAAAQRITSKPIKTFSIGFKEEKYNETKYARQVASHIGSDHNEFIVTEQEATQLVESLLDIYDEPYADSSAIPTLIVSQLAREQVTVALSGDGGDELFMGYGFYTWAKRLGNPFIKALRKPIATALYTMGNNRMKRGSKLFAYPDEQRIKSHIFSQEQYFFTEKEIDGLLLNPVPVTLDETIEKTPRSLSDVEQQSFFDIQNYLPEELLVKTDRASMHHSLEVRVPLLDHRIMEFAINLSENLKLKDVTGKYILKQVLYDYVPAAIFDRPKWGFSIPLQKWLSKELYYMIEKYLDEKIIIECGLVVPDQVKKLRKDYLQGKEYLYNRLWALIILHKWYKEKFL